MQKIIPHLWFDKEAKEAAEFYTSVFNNSKIGKETYYSAAGKEVHGQDKGTLMSIDFEIEGCRFIALNGGPLFKFNPSISFAVRCTSESEVDDLYGKLSAGGSVLMPLDKYDFSPKYAWIADKYGLTWQLSYSEGGDEGAKIVPSLLFVGDQNGKAEEAIDLYTSVLPDSKTGVLSKYEPGEDGGGNAKLKYGQFFLAGQEFSAMDSGLDHKFDFNEAISLLVECEDQAEIDEYWEALSADPNSEQCGWLKDKFGVSWQIAPKGIDHYLQDPDSARAERAMEAVLKMKKLDIAEIKKAAEGL